MTAAASTCGDASVEDVEAITRLFLANGREKDREEMRWHYLDNPAGPSLLGLARREDGELAASYAIMPVRMLVDGRETLGYQSFDTMTHPDNRGQGLFRRLAELTYAEAERREARLVYGFPNSASGPGFFNKLGWTRHGEYPLVARVLRPVRVARQALKLGGSSGSTPGGGGVRLPRTVLGRGHHAVSTVSSTPTDVDALWRSTRPTRGVGLVRDHRYLAWRLDHAAVADRYDRVVAHDGAGALTGFAATTHADKHGMRVGYLVELLGADAAGRRAVRGEALRRLRDQSVDVVFALAAAGSPERGELTRAGFLPVPEKVRPVDLHFGSRAFHGGELPAVWHLSYADADTV